MGKFKLEESSKIRIVRHNIKVQPLIFIEAHIGEKTWVESVYDEALNIAQRKKASLGLIGDLVNADDLRGKGLLTKECIFDQINDFHSLFINYPVKVILQNNHGTRMYNKNLPRQIGENITDKWEKVLSKFREKNTNIEILDPEESCFDLDLGISKGRVWHPSGMSNEDAFIRKVANSISGYDFVILFHFHKNKIAEVIKMCPNGVAETTKFYCVPPLIENPKYGLMKGYPPINAGFLVIYYKKDDLLKNKHKIEYEIISKSDIQNEA